jgi:hypothetical protein
MKAINVHENQNLYVMNIIELGLMPLNLQMFKRDSGLVNLSIYASTYSNYLKTQQGNREENVDITKHYFMKSAEDLHVINHILKNS